MHAVASVVVLVLGFVIAPAKAVDVRGAAVFLGVGAVKDACEALIAERGLSVESIVPVLSWALSEPNSGDVDGDATSIAHMSAQSANGLNGGGAVLDSTDWLIRQCYRWVRDHFSEIVVASRSNPAAFKVAQQGSGVSKLESEPLEDSTLVQLPLDVLLHALQSDFTDNLSTRRKVQRFPPGEDGGEEETLTGEAIILEAALA